MEGNAVEEKGRMSFQQAWKNSKMASDNGNNNNTTISMGEVCPKDSVGNSLSSCSSGHICGVIVILLFSPQAQEGIAGPLPHALSLGFGLSCLEGCPSLWKCGVPVKA